MKVYILMWFLLNTNTTLNGSLPFNTIDACHAAEKQLLAAFTSTNAQLKTVCIEK